MITKTLDAKGRVALGSDFAGKTVVIDNSNPACILIKPVVMIPEQEAWLYKNQAALDRVRQGLDDARNSNFAQQSPDIEADLEWLDDVED